MLNDMMGLNGFVLFAALAVSLVIFVNARVIGERFGVMAKPDGGRRRHALPTPQVGGIAILSALFVWCMAMVLLQADAERNLLFAVILCATGVGIIGFTDDRHETSPVIRMMSLVVFLGVAFVADPGMIASTLNWGSFAPTAIPFWAHFPLMILTCVGLVNAVNMADGQNGIVGSMYVVWSGCLVLTTSGTAQSIAGVLLLGSGMFLIFNLRGKLFLGDCATYGVTFVIGLLTALAHARGQIPLEAVIVWFFVPVVDCLRLLITRPMRGCSPMAGDRDHFHHRLEDKMGKHMGLLTYASVVGASSLVASLEPRFSLVCLVLLTAFYFSFAFLTDSAVIVREKKGDEAVPVLDADRSAKIVAIHPEGRGERKQS
jgi:UDP-GlcNAc:undecaprenyl-phosphate GlcNAc-1-phosphate transferase